MSFHRYLTIAAFAATCLLAPLLYADLPLANKRDVHPPSGEMAMAPRLTADPEGSGLLSWIEAMPGQAADTPRNERKWRMRFARFSDGAWSEARTVVQERDFFVNWADVPSVTQARDGSLLAHWLESSGDDIYAYDVMLARSTDGGETWNLLGPAHDDGTETEHGFVSAVLEGDGVRLFWLDGREMASGDDDDAPMMHGHGHAPGGGDMQLRTALVRGGEIGESIVLDTRVCECCNTGAAMTSNGPIVVYRDRSGEEVRDIGIVRFVDGEWTEPRIVHNDGWSISGCPVNGPAIAASGDTVAVAWFTLAEMRERVLVAFSDDAGATFGKPIEVAGEDALGRVDVIMDGDGEAIVTWMHAGDGDTDMLRLVRINRDGPQGPAMKIADIVPGRLSGFPTFAQVQGDRLIVWTEAEPPVRLRAAMIDF